MPNFFVLCLFLRISLCVNLLDAGVAGVKKSVESKLDEEIQKIDASGTHMQFRSLASLYETYAAKNLSSKHYETFNRIFLRSPDIDFDKNKKIWELWFFQKFLQVWIDSKKEPNFYGNQLIRVLKKLRSQGGEILDYGIFCFLRFPGLLKFLPVESKKPKTSAFLYDTYQKMYIRFVEQGFFINLNKTGNHVKSLMMYAGKSQSSDLYDLFAVLSIGFVYPFYLESAELKPLLITWIQNLTSTGGILSGLDDKLKAFLVNFSLNPNINHNKATKFTVLLSFNDTINLIKETPRLKDRQMFTAYFFYRLNLGTYSASHLKKDKTLIPDVFESFPRPSDELNDMLKLLIDSYDLVNVSFEAALEYLLRIWWVTTDTQIDPFEYFAYFALSQKNIQLYSREAINTGFICIYSTNKERLQGDSEFLKYLYGNFMENKKNLVEKLIDNQTRDSQIKTAWLFVEEDRGIIYSFLTICLLKTYPGEIGKRNAKFFPEVKATLLKYFRNSAPLIEEVLSSVETFKYINHNKPESNQMSAEEVNIGNAESEESTSASPEQVEIISQKPISIPEKKESFWRKNNSLIVISISAVTVSAIAVLFWLWWFKSIILKC
jgi:hypothetical protein